MANHPRAFIVGALEAPFAQPFQRDGSRNGLTGWDHTRLWPRLFISLLSQQHQARCQRGSAQQADGQGSHGILLGSRGG